MFLLSCLCFLSVSLAFQSSFHLRATSGKQPRFCSATRYHIPHTARKMRRSLHVLKAQLSEDDEEELQRMKEERVLPFDKGSSEFIPSEMCVAVSSVAVHKFGARLISQG